MRIVVVSQWFPPEKAAIPADIARGLASSGHEVTVLTGFPNYPTGRIYEGWRVRPVHQTSQDGYAVRRVVLYPSHDRSAVRRVANYSSFATSAAVLGARALRRANVVYVYHPPLTTAAGPWLARRRHGVPYVLHVQDLWPDSVVHSGMLEGRAARAAGRLLDRTCRAAYASAAGIVTIAPTMADLLESRGVPRSRLHVVPNWADEELFWPVARSEGGAAAAELPRGFTVMFAGNIGYVQGLEVAVRAAVAVRDLPDFHLVLVGDGLERSRLEALAREIGADNVRFLGSRPLEDMPALTAAADVQLVSLLDLPFLRGTIPSKLGSVLASGLPVICAVAGDGADLVAEAGAGWVCQPESVSALADAFRSAYAAPPAELERLRTAARSYYERELSRAKALRRLENVLTTAGGAAPAGSPA